MIGHPYNPSYLEGGDQDDPTFQFKASLGKKANRTPVSTNTLVHTYNPSHVGAVGRKITVQDPLGAKA
jgi:hypothetical protein